MAIVIILVWIVCAVLCASIASAKGHSGCLWGLLGLVFGFFALLVVAVIPAYRPPGPVEVTIRREKETPREPPLRSTSAKVLPSLREEKKCPDCAEMVLSDARVCRHCGYRFDGSGDVKAIEPPAPEPDLQMRPDADMRAAATTLRALAEAAGPMHMGQSHAIFSFVARESRWGRLGRNEERYLMNWVTSHETGSAGLRDALQRIARWRDRGRIEEFQSTASLIMKSTTDGQLTRQRKFYDLLNEIAGSKS